MLASFATTTGASASDIAGVTPTQLEYIDLCELYDSDDEDYGNDDNEEEYEKTDEEEILLCQPGFTPVIEMISVLPVSHYIHGFSAVPYHTISLCQITLLFVA